MSISLGGRRLLVTVVGAAALLTPAALASGASAATLTVDKACYIRTGSTPPNMTVTGAGYTPADEVQVTSSDGSVDQSVTADPAGNISVVTPAPEVNFDRPGAKALTLTATDNTEAGQTITGATPVTVSVLGFSHGGTKKAPGLKALTESTNWAFSGYPEGKTVWAHYLVGKRVTARQSFGKAQGPCGLVTKVRRPLYPATPHGKTYKIQVDAAKKYSRSTFPRVIGTISLKLEF